ARSRNGLPSRCSARCRCGTRIEAARFFLRPDGGGWLATTAPTSAGEPTMHLRFALLLLPAFAGRAAADDFKLDKDCTTLSNGKDRSGWEYVPVPVTKKPVIEKDLDGKTATKDKVFEVKDGLVVASGKKIMALYTAKEYNTDFQFKMEFRNSGEKPKDN